MNYRGVIYIMLIAVICVTTVSCSNSNHVFSNVTAQSLPPESVLNTTPELQEETDKPISQAQSQSPVTSIISPNEEITQWRYDENGFFIPADIYNTVCRFDAVEMVENFRHNAGLADYKIGSESFAAITNATVHYYSFAGRSDGVGSIPINIAVLEMWPGFDNASRNREFFIFAKKAGAWRVEGYVKLFVQFYNGFRIEHTNDGSQFWLVTTGKTSHGTASLSTFETWYAPNGVIEAEYPINGFSGDSYFNGSSMFDGDATISISYDMSVNCIENFDQDNAIKLPLAREECEYNLNTGKFVTINSSVPDAIEDGKEASLYEPTAKYIEYFKTISGLSYEYGTSDWSLDEWMMFLGKTAYQ